MKAFEIFNSCKEIFPEIQHWPEYIPPPIQTDFREDIIVFGLSKNESIEYYFKYLYENPTDFIDNRPMINELFIVKNNKYSMSWSFKNNHRIYLNANVIKYLRTWKNIGDIYLPYDPYSVIDQKIDQVLKELFFINFLV